MKKRLLLVLFTLFGMMAFSQSKGRVLNVYCFNEFFPTLVKMLPGYNMETDTMGKVKVNWIIYPNEDNVYLKQLNAALLNSRSQNPDERIDLFIAESDYVSEYIDTDYVMPVSELGITDADLKYQLDYAKNIGTDYKGKLKALVYTLTPGGFVYRRSYAKQVLGTDEPDKVQSMIDTWDKFDDVAKRMDAAGIYMLAGCEDSFKVFCYGKSSPWVKKNGKIIIDNSLKRWVRQSKMYTDKLYNNRTDMWTVPWTEGALVDGKVFGYFGPYWFIDYVMPHGEDSASGDWAFCKGPQGFNWGGDLICAVDGTDNADLIKEIMLALTCNERIMTDIAYYYGYIVNNANILYMLSKYDWGSSFLGGQNPYRYYLESAESIDCSNVTGFDQGLNEIFMSSMKEYFEGKVTEEQAYDNFYQKAIEFYPILER